MLAVDERGEVVDGDAIIAVLALHLGVELVAVTQMTNLGFHRLMAERGIRVVTTDVGDRYVLEALEREGGRLGGEQSGHVLWLDGHVTGDGLVAALLLCRAIEGKRLSEATSVMERCPQSIENVAVVGRRELSPAIRDGVAQVNAELGDEGRVLVRPSGTEPVVRVLAEASTQEDRRQSLCYHRRARQQGARLTAFDAGRGGRPGSFCFRGRKFPRKRAIIRQGTPNVRDYRIRRASAL